MTELLRDLRGRIPQGRHDPAQRRRGLRRGRERGCWLYVPAEVLELAGVDSGGPPPFYRTWPGRKRSVMVQLYEGP